LASETPDHPVRPRRRHIGGAGGTRLTARGHVDASNAMSIMAAWLPLGLRADLVALATRRGTTLSEQVRRLLQRAIAEEMRHGS